MSEVLTGRLRLVPIGPSAVDEIVAVHTDPWVAQWYDGAYSTTASATEYAERMAAEWEREGAGKWLAYERDTGRLVGRGGVTRLAPDDPVVPQIAPLVSPDWDRLELGWALLAAGRGHGYAVEIGRAGLDLAARLGDLQVIAFTEQHNRASRSVMERLAMVYAGEVSAAGLVSGLDGVHPDAPFAVYSQQVVDPTR